MFDIGIANAADGAAQGGGLLSFLPLVLIFAVFYFLLIRPQQKKQKDHLMFLSKLNKGDSVVTSGGLYGEITGMTDNIVTLEIADNVRVKVSRQHILGSAASLSATADTGKKTGG